MQKQSFRKMFTYSLQVAALCSAAPFALAACEEPQFTMAIPDGQSASQDEMARAQTAVSKFVSDGEAYIACVEMEEGRLQYERLRDAMLDEMEQVAAQFNRQLRYFRRNNS